MTREEAKVWVNRLFNIEKEALWNKRLVDDAKEVEQAQNMAMEALQQPEIVFCADCEHWDRELIQRRHPDGKRGSRCLKCKTFVVETHYCGFGERREK